ncbi:MAG: PDZ domain-containing protein [Gemmatimonadaceae bacterium]|nr:PDZ domain-containing protein [Gemmatimonadaceae bacterium]
MTALSRSIALCTILGALVAPSLHAQKLPPDTVVVRKRTTYEDLQMFSQVLNQIRVNHPDSIDSHVLLMAAIQGMVHAADPHSFVIPAVRLSPAREQALKDGKLFPIPVDFEYRSGAPIVVAVAPGTAAARQDILPGDQLVAIEGKPVTAESAQELDVMLSGDKGSTATLSLERLRADGTLARLDRIVKREKEGEATAVPAVFMLDPAAGTGYVRITSFMNEKVADDLHDALGRLEGKGMTRLVLDLRDNGGGSVAEAAHVAGEFLPKGTIVYTSEGRKAADTDTGRVSRSFWKSERRYPIVLLVNAGTASASELVAGALQDHDRALIVGHTTFGKSLLMRGFPMADGSMIELVVGHVRTPCGRIIQRQYHGISLHDYYRLAGADRDTVNRPSCKTDGGRTVYGGGGIYPDMRLPDAPSAPAWLARASEDDLLLKWTGAWVTANATSLTSLDALASSRTLPAAAL